MKLKLATVSTAFALIAAPASAQLLGGGGLGGNLGGSLGGTLGGTLGGVSNSTSGTARSSTATRLDRNVDTRQGRADPP